MIRRLTAGGGAFVAADDGATAVEYGLIAAGIAVVLITVIFAIGGDIEGFFATIRSYF